jgi:hypothetical protein
MVDTTGTPGSSGIVEHSVMRVFSPPKACSRRLLLGVIALLIDSLWCDTPLHSALAQDAPAMRAAAPQSVSVYASDEICSLCNSTTTLPDDVAALRAAPLSVKSSSPGEVCITSADDYQLRSLQVSLFSDGLAKLSALQLPGRQERSRPKEVLSIAFDARTGQEVPTSRIGSQGASPLVTRSFLVSLPRAADGAVEQCADTVTNLVDAVTLEASAVISARQASPQSSGVAPMTSLRSAGDNKVLSTAKCVLKRGVSVLGFCAKWTLIPLGVVGTACDATDAAQACTTGDAGKFVPRIMRCAAGGLIEIDPYTQVWYPVWDDCPGEGSGQCRIKTETNRNYCSRDTAIHLCPDGACCTHDSANSKLRDGAGCDFSGEVTVNYSVGVCRPCDKTPKTGVEPTDPLPPICPKETHPCFPRDATQQDPQVDRVACCPMDKRCIRDHPRARCETCPNGRKPCGTACCSSDKQCIQTPFGGVCATEWESIDEEEEAE